MEKGEKINWREDRKKIKERRKKYKQENILKQLDKIKAQNESADTNIAEPIDSQNAKLISTISIAVPGSILENAQSAELRTYLAGQIARAACIFKVDEVIVYDETGHKGATDPKQRKVDPSLTNSDSDQSSTVSRSCLQLARILQYLECPQYLRKFFFPIHNDLKFSGLLNPLDAPHHLRQQNDFIYREGVVTNKPAKGDRGSYVNIGLLNDCLVDKVVTPGMRVTVKLQPLQNLRKKVNGSIVSPRQPRSDTGVYWGYSVRIAKSLSEIFTKSPYENGYDLTIGTSDRGTSVHDIENSTLMYDHALIVYGGLQGLESALESDDQFDADDPKLIFDRYLNVIPGQGSRTIRTEEAILISLAALEEKLNPNQKAKPFCLSESIPQSGDTGLNQFAQKKEKNDLSRFD